MRRLLALGWMAGHAAIRSLGGRLLEFSSELEVTATGRTEGRRPSVLVVSPYPVHPPIHGGAVRIFNLVKRLADHTDVSLFLFSGGTDDPPQREVFERFCRRVFFQRFPEPDRRSDPWGRLPPVAARFASSIVADRIAAIVAAHRVDVVFLEYTELASLTGPYPGARVVLVEHDLSFRSHSRQMAVGIGRTFDTRNAFGWGFGDRLRRFNFELAACDRVDQIHVMSETDASVLSRYLRDGSQRIRVIPNGVDTALYRPPERDRDRHGALFVGSFPHLPNLDALHHLVRDVWPLVRQVLPDAELTVAGARPPESVLMLDGRDGIRVVGEVPDMAPFYRRHRVLAVPIRAGSGTRLKILEAMACGLPVVSTSLGAEGIDCQPGRDLVVADQPAAMAAAIAGLLEGNGARWRSLSEHGRQLVVRRYDWGGVANRLRQAIDELGAEPERGVGFVGEDLVREQGPMQASIVIAVRRGGQALDRCLSGIAEQSTTRPFEIVAVDLGASKEDRQLLQARGARVVLGPAGATGEGSAANLGAAASHGRVLVFLSADATPADDGWLDRLLAPFDSPDAPAAVQGGVTAQFVSGAPPHDPRFTREAARWRVDHGGVAVSMANMAVRRDIWDAFPFAPSSALTDLRWQRQAAENDLLILPRWDAAVVWVRSRDARSVVRESAAEGLEWRGLGVHYGLWDLVTDLRRARPYLDGQGRSVPTPPNLGTGTERHFGRLRPPALFLGNHFPRAARAITRARRLEIDIED